MMLLQLPQLQGEMPGSHGWAGSQVSRVLGRETGGHPTPPSTQQGRGDRWDCCWGDMGMWGFGRGSY